MWGQTPVEWGQTPIGYMGIAPCMWGQTLVEWGQTLDWILTGGEKRRNDQEISESEWGGIGQIAA